MKRFVLFLALASFAAPLFAADDGGDGANIPSIPELIREGYYHSATESGDETSKLLIEAQKTAPKPTQAYYDQVHHCTIYYGFRPVAVNRMDPTELYAFRYPIVFFRNLIPESNNVNLGRLAVAVYDHPSSSTSTAAAANPHHEPVTTVTPVKPAKASGH